MADDRSIAEQLAALPDEQRRAIVEGLSTDETALLIETLMKAIGTLNGTRDQHKERVEPN